MFIKIQLKSVIVWRTSLNIYTPSHKAPGRGHPRMIYPPNFMVERMGICCTPGLCRIMGLAKNYAAVRSEEFNMHIGPNEHARTQIKQGWVPTPDVMVRSGQASGTKMMKFLAIRR